MRVILIEDNIYSRHHIRWAYG